MNSSSAKDLASRSPFGVDKIGLPPTITIARIWPSPGVEISSAIAEAGYSPSTSGCLPTREWPRPVRKPLPEPPAPRVFPLPATGNGNIAPPTRSRLPVKIFTTSTSHEAVVPNAVVVVPIRA